MAGGTAVDAAAPQWQQQAEAGEATLASEAAEAVLLAAEEDEEESLAAPPVTSAAVASVLRQCRSRPQHSPCRCIPTRR